MKKIVIMTVLIIQSTACSQQGIEVSPFLGYQYGGSHSVSQGEINISSATDYGIIFSIPVKETPGLRAEIYLSRQETDLNYQESSFQPMTKLFAMSSSYLLAGGSYEEDLGTFTPIGMMAVGLANLDPKDPGFVSEWFLAAMVGFGFKTYFSERFGLRLQGRLLAPIQVTSGSLWCSSESGCYIELTGGSIIVQADASIGLIIVF